MRALAVAVVVLVGACIMASAQVGQIGRAGVGASVTSTYSGPGDLGLSVSGWWGLRAFSNAKAAANANLAIITRASDSTTCTASSDINGNMDVSVAAPCAGSTTVTSWCNSTTCSVTTLKDQSGAGQDMTSNALATAPVLTFSCLNTSLPCMTFTHSSSMCLATGTITTISQPYTFSTVAKRTGNFTTNQSALGGATTAYIGFPTTADFAAAQGSAEFNFAAPDSTVYAENMLFNGASSMFNLDGREIPLPSIGSNATGTRIDIGATGPCSASANQLTGIVAEGGVYGTTTATQRRSLCTNQHAYWATTNACATGAYAGPGDVQSGWTGWWGLRAFNNAKAVALANIAIITRSSDTTTCTVVSDVNGNLDLAGTPCAGTTTIGTWCNATTCSVTTLYDQSGGGHDMTQGTLSKAPVLTFTCLHTSLPCMTFTASAAQILLTGSFSNASQPYTYSVVHQRTANFTTQQDIFGASAATGGGYLLNTTSANKMALYAGLQTATQTVNDSAEHALQGLFSSTSSILNHDGVESAALSASTNAQVTPFALGNNNASTAGVYVDGKIAEAGAFGTSTATQRNALCSNQYSYWLTVTSC